MPVPRTTAWRWSKKVARKKLHDSSSEDETEQAECYPQAMVDHENIQPAQNQTTTLDSSPNCEAEYPCSALSSCNTEMDEPLGLSSHTSDQANFLDLGQCHTLNANKIDMSKDTSSESTDHSSTDDSNSSTDDDSEETDDSSEESSDEEDNEEETQESTELTVKELQTLALASFVVRHNLTGVATFDLCKLIKALCPDNLKTLSEKEIHSFTNDMHIKVVHYCHCCCSTFDDDPDIFRCTTVGCTGLRYNGGMARQTRKSRQPRKSFVVGDIKGQLTKILTKNGIWESIQKQKSRAKQYGENVDVSLSDIICGNSYQELMKEGNFLADSNSILEPSSEQHQ